ncbi:MAG: DUF917 domain-containing protein [Candidatus Sulfotelmatobacter sp.]
MRNLSRQNLEDIIMGCCYLGSGGGGSYEAGLKRIHDDLAAGLKFNLISVDEMKDDDYAATTYYVGSTAPYTPEQIERFNKLPRIKDEATAVAFRLLQKHVGKNFVAVIAGEIGAGNTPYALSTAAHLGIAQLDADTAGRAVPEIDQSTIFAAGISLLPTAAATLFGDELLITKVATPSREEEFLRIASTISMHIAAADSALPGKLLKQPNIVVQGSLTLCEEIGKAYRVAVESQKDPIQAVLDASNGYKVFAGAVSAHDWADKGGYLVGDVEIGGAGLYSGQRYKLGFKNENLISWRDGKVSITSPDIITMIDNATGRAVLNPDFTKGQKVTIIGIPAPSPWRTAAGLRVCGPEHFGYDASYIPIEERHRTGNI